MNENSTFVSIIIPAINEAVYIATCLDSVLSNDYPKDRMEIFVVDGMSSDKTKDIASKYAQEHSFVKLLENEKKTTPFAMNMGITQAKGELIMKMDGHTIYEKDYISKCVQYSGQYNADNVGGVLVTRPGADTFIAKAIAAGLMQRFGSGNSYFRVGSKKPREADTVAFGCYKREVFEKIGMYDERLTRSQDMELNQRLRKAGGKIILAPDIVGYYYAKPTFGSFLRHNVLDGIWTTYPLAFGIRIFSARHLMPLAFVSALAVLGVGSFFVPIFGLGFMAVAAAYLIVNFTASLTAAFQERDLRYAYALPIVFAIRHLGYGIGSLLGLGKTLVFKLKLGYNG